MVLVDIDLEAARQLLHLSESGNDSANSASSSPRSVNTRSLSPAAIQLAVVYEWEKEMDVGSRRREKRCRQVSDIYAATASMGDGVKKRR